jgi:2Fe-2S ferredoxin
MGTIIVESRNGAETTLQAEPSKNLMEIMRASGIEEILALCGGTCSCSTCHIVVAPEFADRLAPIGADENDLLDNSEHRAPTSRLACQIVFEDSMDGMRLKIAPED